MKKIVDVYDLKQSPYQETWDLQHLIQKQIIAEKRAEQKGEFVGERKNDVLLLVEHPHVYTLGKSGDEANLLKNEDELNELDATFVKIDRGGDITYHGPGQIVGYPIMDLDRYFTDIHKYLRYLEEVIIKTCADYGIDAGRIDGLTGVWIGEEKICAMGIRSSRWVTMHGFAFNVNAHLNYFKNIVPCGIDDKAVTSLDKILGKPIPMQEVKNKVITNFEEVFDVDLHPRKALPEEYAKIL